MVTVFYVCRECGEYCDTNNGGAKPFRVSRCHQAAVITEPVVSYVWDVVAAAGGTR